MENLKKIIVFNLILIFFLTAFLKVKADTSANTALSLAITGGSLSVTAPASADFAGKSFSFESQTSSNNPIGTIEVEDARGTATGWNVNVSATDWTSGANTMKYNSDASSTGQLSLDIPDISGVQSMAGADTSGITMGVDDNFDSGTSAIKLLGSSNGHGAGIYDISGLNASQSIPAQQATGTYATHLTLTIQ